MFLVQRQLIKERVCLAGLDHETWNESHDEPINAFLTDNKRLLIVYIDRLGGLSCDNVVPYVTVGELAYFIKRYDGTLITYDNFQKTVQYGTVTGGHIQSLLRLMMGIYAPIFFENTSWPDSIKNDFSAQLHRFLASLTDTRWKLDGKTVLYIPTEGLNLQTEVAAKNKELVQRLESKKFL
jgi:dynein heavy chain